MDAAPKRTPERDAYYDKIGEKALTPLWEVLANLVTKEPVTPVQAHIWRYEEVRPHVMEAGALITAEEAERRVLAARAALGTRE